MEIFVNKIHNTKASNNVDYTYSTEGENTSVQSYARRVKDYKISKYKIREKNSSFIFGKKRKIDCRCNLHLH